MHHARMKDYAGRWVLRQSGRDVIVLNMRAHHVHSYGTVMHPARFTERDGGHLIDISKTRKIRPVVGKGRKVDRRAEAWNRQGCR